ncbi:hypothetical protein CP8484711_1376B, partial [Chlamydia psittaci 84-8471/1]
NNLRTHFLLTYKAILLKEKQ